MTSQKSFSRIFQKKSSSSPYLDSSGSLVAITRQKPSVIQIGKYIIDNNSPTFIIAEIGNNHNGSLELAKTKKPLICSTGMATEAEIKEAIALLKKNGALYILLHCNSTYPAPFKDVNLNYCLSRLQI